MFRKNPAWLLPPPFPLHVHQEDGEDPSIELFFPTAENRRRLHAGPLARYIDGFAVWLSVEGYARPSAREKLRFVELLSRWLESEELGVEDLDEQRVEAFLLARGWSNGRRGETATGRQLLCYLRGSGVIPAAVPCPDSDTPIDRIYAKVDLDALRAFAPAWPGGVA